MATNTVDFNKLPLQQSFTILQNNDLIYPQRLQIKSEAATTYSDFSLTGCQLKLYVKKGSTTVVDGTAQTVDTASEGKFTMRVAAATTASWTGEYLYELDLVVPVGNTHFPSGCTKTIMQGRVRVKTDIG